MFFIKPSEAVSQQVHKQERSVIWWKDLGLFKHHLIYLAAVVVTRVLHCVSVLCICVLLAYLCWLCNWHLCYYPVC